MVVSEWCSIPHGFVERSTDVYTYSICSWLDEKPGLQGVQASTLAFALLLQSEKKQHAC